MRCKNCGEKLSAFSLYCENCGAQAQTTKEWCLYYFGIFLAFIKKRMWLIPVAVVALVIAIGLGIWSNISNKVDFTEFVVTQVSGFDNNGSIVVDIDYNALAEKILGPLPDKSTAKGYEKYVKYMEQTEALSDSLRVYTDRTDGLKNGDFYFVTVTVLYKEIFEELGVKLENGRYQDTFQVGVNSPSFDTPVELDVFDYVEVSFSGNNGNGYIVISDDAQMVPVSLDSGRETQIEIRSYQRFMYNDYACVVSFVDTYNNVTIAFSADKSSNLSNGESVKLSVSDSDVEALNNYGITLKTFEKTYQVTDLAQ